MPDAQNFLQAMYKEQCDQARQHENMRQQSTSLVVTVCSALVAFSTTAASWFATRGGSGLVLMATGSLVLCLGWFGRALSLKHYERNRMHTTRAGGYRRELEQLFPGMPYGGALRNRMETDHETDWKANSPDPTGAVIASHLYQSWMAIYWFVIALGVLLCAIGIVTSRPSN